MSVVPVVEKWGLICKKWGACCWVRNVGAWISNRGIYEMGAWMRLHPGSLWGGSRHQAVAVVVVGLSAVYFLHVGDEVEDFVGVADLVVIP